MVLAGVTWQSPDRACASLCPCAQYLELNGGGAVGSTSQKTISWRHLRAPELYHLRHQLMAISRQIAIYRGKQMTLYKWSQNGLVRRHGGLDD